MNARTRFQPVLIEIKIVMGVLLFVGLFVLGVPAPTVQGMVWQPVLSTPVAPQVSAVGGGAFSETLASFTALIPEIAVTYLPVIIK